MNIEFEIDDTALRGIIERCVKDYVYNDSMVKSLCRQAIYQMTAQAAEKVLKDAPETLRELVTRELKGVLADRSEY